MGEVSGIGCRVLGNGCWVTGLVMDMKFDAVTWHQTREVSRHPSLPTHYRTRHLTPGTRYLIPNTLSPRHSVQPLLR